MSWHDGLVETFPVPTSKRVYPLQPEVTDLEDEFTDLAVLDVSTASLSSFPFLSLPPELRNRIYTLILFNLTREPKCLPSRRLPTSLFLASSQVHEEASYIFYTSHKFRIFPIQEFRPLPTLFEVPSTYQVLLTRAQVILGPSFTSPPPSLKVTRKVAKALGKLKRLTCLDVFVALDPSHPIFARFKFARKFPEFAGNLIRDLLVAMPQIEAVSIDRNPSVSRDGPLVSQLRMEVENQGRKLYWDDKAAVIESTTNLRTVCGNGKGSKENSETPAGKQKQTGSKKPC